MLPINSITPQSHIRREPEAKKPAPSERAPAAHHQPELLPATNIHPVVAVIGVGCYGWILLMAWRAFAYGTTVLDLWISLVIFIMTLGLPLKCASMARNVTPERETQRDFEAFLEGSVDTYTGTMPGRQAMFEILLAPVALALAATGFCIVAIIYSL